MNRNLPENIADLTTVQRDGCWTDYIRGL